MGSTHGSPAPANWPQSYRDSGHTGWNRTESTLSTANAGNLTLKWGKGVNCGTMAFALSDGVIYARGQGSDCGTHDLEAIDAATGAKKWTVTVGQGGVGINETVAVAYGLVFTGCHFDDAGGRYSGVCAYRHTNGKRVWRWANPCNCLPNAGVLLPLVYANGAVYFGYEDGGGGCGDPSYIVAADAKTGNTLWTYGTGGCNTLDGSGSAPAVAGGHVYFSANKSLYAISQTDGSFLWSVPFGGSGDALQISVAAAGNAVYAVGHNFSTGTQAVALDAATGAQRWAHSLPDGNTPPPAFANGRLYVRAGDGNLYVLRAGDGKLMWSTPDGQVAGSASDANGVLYAGGGAHQYAVRAFDDRNGTLLWNSSGNGSTLNPPPVVADGVLYNANDDSCGNICAFALP